MTEQKKNTGIKRKIKNRKRPEKDRKKTGKRKKIKNKSEVGKYEEEK